MSSFSRLSGQYVPLIEDHSLFNALYGINPRDVEHAIRGEILIISGKRRRRPILDSDEEEEDKKAEKIFQPGTKCETILIQERKHKIRVRANQDDRVDLNYEEKVTRKVINAQRKLKPLYGLENVEDGSKLMSDEFKDPVIKISYMTDFESGGTNPFAESINIVQVGVVTVQPSESKGNGGDPPNPQRSVSAGGGAESDHENDSSSTASNRPLSDIENTVHVHKKVVTEKFKRFINHSHELNRKNAGAAKPKKIITAVTENPDKKPPISKANTVKVNAIAGFVNYVKPKPATVGNLSINSQQLNASQNQKSKQGKAKQSHPLNHLDKTKDASSAEKSNLPSAALSQMSLFTYVQTLVPDLPDSSDITLMTEKPSAKQSIPRQVKRNQTGGSEFPENQVGTIYRESKQSIKASKSLPLDKDASSTETSAIPSQMSLYSYVPSSMDLSSQRSNISSKPAAYTTRSSANPSVKSNPAHILELTDSKPPPLNRLNVTEDSTSAKKSALPSQMSLSTSVSTSFTPSSVSTSLSQVTSTSRSSKPSAKHSPPQKVIRNPRHAGVTKSLLEKTPRVEETNHNKEAKRRRHESKEVTSPPEENIFGEENMSTVLNHKDSMFSIITPPSPDENVRPLSKHAFFHNSEISSASDLYKIQKPEAFEMDKEWLKYESNEKIKLREQKTVDRTIDPEPVIAANEDAEKMMKCFGSLFTLMKFTGRMPVKYFKKDDTHHTFEFDRTSRNFQLFCVSSAFLTVCCISMIIGLFTIVNTKKPYTFYEFLLATEFDKFWVEVMMMSLSLVFTCIWSVGIIFETGLHLGEYLTRWNLCIALLKYEVTRNLRQLIYLGYAIYGAYAFILIILFFAGGDDIPTVREASGFMALMIFQPYGNELRIHPSYYVLEYFGLIIHLYSVLCCGMILLMILAYAKALKNAAQRFNLRLAYVLRKVILPSENRKYLNIRRYIPYEKLYAEHIVITSFSRHMGTVFGVPLVAFYATKVVAMVVTLYSLFSPIVNSFPQYNQTFVNLTSVDDASSVIPIRYDEPREVIIGKSVYLICEAWFTYLVFSEIMSNAGETIMNGFAIIRRHGLLSCKSSDERRFISSMQNSFSNKTSFYINPLFKINRESILAYVGFVIAMFIFLTQFSPQRLTNEVSIVCNSVGVCRKVTYRKFWTLSQAVQRNKYEKPIPPPTEPPQPPTTTREYPQITGRPKPGRYDSAPCKPSGSAPIQITDFFYPCNPSESPLVYRPLLYQKVIQNGRVYFDRILPSCDSTVNIKKPVYDCFGQELFDFTGDECHALSLPTPDKDGKPVKDTSIKLVTFNPNIKEKEYLYCCWSYSQLKAQEGTCNLENGRDAKKICQKKVGSAPGTESRRELYENLFWREVRAQSGKLNDLKVSWTDCICQYTTGVLKLKDDCKALVSDYPPCSPEFEKWQPSQGLWKTSMCSWNEYRSLDKGIKQQILYKRDEFLQYFPISKANVAGCEKITYLNKDFNFKLDPEDTLVDCFGKIQDESIVETVDDCQHLNLVGGTQTMHLEYFDTTNLPPGLIKRSIFCCYTIGCNLQASSISKRCGKSPKGSERSGMEALFWTYLKEHGNRLDIKELDEWTICICQGVGTKNSWQYFLCKSLLPTTAGTTSTTTTPTTTTPTTTTPTTTTPTTTTPTTTTPTTTTPTTTTPTTTTPTTTTPTTTTPTTTKKPTTPGENIKPCDARFISSRRAPSYWNEGLCPWSRFVDPSQDVFRMSLLYQQKFISNEYQYTPVAPEGNKHACENFEYPPVLRLLEYSYNYKPGANTKITDCWGKEVRTDDILTTRDDCQNLQLTMGVDVSVGGISEPGPALATDLRLVYLKERHQTYCCYSWNANHRCNFSNDDKFKEVAKTRCNWRIKSTEFNKMEDMIKKELSSAGTAAHFVEKKWTTCLCQGFTNTWNKKKCKI